MDAALRAVLEHRLEAPGGLTSAEAEARLKAEGQNVLPAQKGPGLLRMAAGQLVHFIALLLWAASALAFIGGMPQLGVAIAVVVLVNAAFSFVQEYRAQRAVAALHRLMPAGATVIRDGARHDIEAAEVVRGDLLLLGEGDRIPADCRIVASDGMAVDNSLLTGESEPVEKGFGASAGGAEPADQVFAGTFVVRGSCQAVATATGKATRLGAITAVTGGVVRRATPLQRQLNHAVLVIGAFALATGAAFLGVSLGLHMSLRFGFLFAVGVVVALVPEGLLPTLTLSLALSARRLARERVLVRQLESVETLGSTTLICTDKTGTLTANQEPARIGARTGAARQPPPDRGDRGRVAGAAGLPLCPAAGGGAGPAGSLGRAVGAGRGRAVRPAARGGGPQGHRPTALVALVG